MVPGRRPCRPAPRGRAAGGPRRALGRRQIRPKTSWAADPAAAPSGPGPPAGRGAGPPRPIAWGYGEMRHGPQEPARPGGRLQAPRPARPRQRPGPRRRRHGRPTCPRRRPTPGIDADLRPAGVTIAELHIDRGYLASPLVRDRPPGAAHLRKALAGPTPATASPRPPSSSTGSRHLRCPAGAVRPFAPGGTVHFPARPAPPAPCARVAPPAPTAAASPSTPTSASWPSYAPAPTTAGRARLRERVAVEHALAHVGRWQGAALATAASARTSSTYGAPPSSTTSTSSPALPPTRRASPPLTEYLTGALDRV